MFLVAKETHLKGGPPGLRRNDSFRAGFVLLQSSPTFTTSPFGPVVKFITSLRGAHVVEIT
jgi:hypothetical protein